MSKKIFFVTLGLAIGSCTAYVVYNIVKNIRDNKKSEYDLDEQFEDDDDDFFDFEDEEDLDEEDPEEEDEESETSDEEDKDDEPEELSQDDQELLKEELEKTLKKHGENITDVISMLQSPRSQCAALKCALAMMDSIFEVVTYDDGLFIINELDDFLTQIEKMDQDNRYHYTEKENYNRRGGKKYVRKNKKKNK